MRDSDEYIRRKLNPLREKSWKGGYESIDDLAAPFETSVDYLRGFLEGGPGDSAMAIMFRMSEDTNHIAFRVLRMLTKDMSPEDVKKIVARAQEDHRKAERKRIDDLIENM